MIVPDNSVKPEKNAVSSTLVFRSDLGARDIVIVPLENPRSGQLLDSDVDKPVKFTIWFILSSKLLPVPATCFRAETSSWALDMFKLVPCERAG